MKKQALATVNQLFKALAWLARPSSWLHIFRINYALFIGTSSLLLNGLGFPLVGVYLWLQPRATQLPAWLSWFDNADNDGIYGDMANQQRNKAFGWEPTGFLAKMHWLMIRNPLNKFKYRVLGFCPANIERYSAVVEQPYVLGQFVGDYSSGGLRYIEVILRNGQKKWEYYAVLPYMLGSKSLCFRARLGWVINNPNEPDEFQSQRRYFRFTCSINPFKTYRGRIANLPLAKEEPSINNSQAKIIAHPSKTFTPGLNHTLKNSKNNILIEDKRSQQVVDPFEAKPPNASPKLLSRL